MMRPLPDGDPNRTDGPSTRRLPLALDSFVGRAAEQAEVASMLGRSRLVTVVGPAGVGKTRLALETASALAPGYPHGAVFVALAGPSGPSLVPQAVASALGVGERPGRDLTVTLSDYLRSRRLLLVLDNCEHVAAKAAALVEGLLRSCGGLSVLATSQEALGVAGEQVWALAPLGVPASEDDTEESPAVRLFCERAAAIRPDFALNAEVAPAVAEICRRLDGVALAIELAAARVAVLSPAEIAARLADRLALLAGGGRGGPARHQSLRAAIDWSHDLCSGPEQALLRRLSVFAGGATLAAASTVCAGGELAGAPMLDTLSGLVAKSLVAADTIRAETRYRLLETLRLYAGERLEGSGEAAEVQGRHARWFAVVAEEAEPGLTGADQRRWLERLGVEQDNLRAALDWALEHREAVVALRLAGALTLWWRVRGSFSEARTYLVAALALAGEVPAGLRAKAAWGAALMAVMIGDPVGALALAEEALDLYRGLGDTAGWARSLLVAANCHALLGAPVAAQPLLEQSVALARDAGDDWCLAHALALGALSHRSQGEPAAARALADEAVSVARRSRDAQGLRIGLILLGEIALGHGDLDAAEVALGEAMAVTADLGETYGTAGALVGLAEVALTRGDHDRALGLLEEGEQGARAAGTPNLVVDALYLRARLAQDNDDLAAARRLYDEAVLVAAEAGGYCAAALRGLGEVAWAEDDTGAAGRLFDEALERARAAADHREVAAVLADIADLAHAAGDHGRAVALHHEVLALRRRAADTRGLVESIESLGSLGVDSGRRRADGAARLLGAAEALRQAHGYVPTSAQRRRREHDLARLRLSLDPGELEGAWAQGTDFSIQQAVSYATKGRGSRNRPAVGWSSLTKTEREVAELAAGGLSNAEIADQLKIATGTVKGHLKRVFAKLDISSRIDLARNWPRQLDGDR